MALPHRARQKSLRLVAHLAGARRRDSANERQVISPLITSLRRESLFAQAFPSPALSRAPTIHIICPGTNIFHGLDVVKDELHSGRNSPVESLGMLRSREPDTDSRYMVEPNTSGCGISSRYGGPRPCFLIPTTIPWAAYAALRISTGSRMTAIIAIRPPQAGQAHASTSYTLRSGVPRRRSRSPQRYSLFFTIL